MSPYIRKVPTSSGAMAVQIMTKRQGRQVVLEHLGSAHGEAELAVLMHVAHEHLHVEGQQVFDFGDGTVGPGVDAGDALRVVGSASRVLWEVLEAAWEQLGLGVIADEAFKQLVFARLIEPASKRDTVRILKEIGVCSIHLSTVKRCLKRVVERDYRAILDGVFHQHALATGGLALCLYDVTTLYFEAEDEDELRKVGYSKERRVDPQVVIGLLVDSRGFPLQIRAFPGNKAETHTLLPVLQAYKKLHGIDDLIVVADAGMLSEANMRHLEQAGYRFIVGNRSRKTNDDLLPHYQAHGLVLADG